MLKQVPKTDLHNHACLGYHLSRLSQHLGRHIPPAPDRLPSWDAFIEYLKAYLHPYIYTREGFEFSIDASLQEATEDGVVRLEMSIDAQMHGIYQDCNLLIDFLKRMDEKYPAVDFKPELGINREWDEETMEAWVMPLIECGKFFSVDLYGNEALGEPEVFIRYFKVARQNGMLLKAHAGEYREAEFVRRTVEVLELDEVQHGIAVASSPEIMRWLADRGTPLHICPTSNIVLERVADLRAHPVRYLVDHGVTVTLNSDDIIIFNSTVSEEYLKLHDAEVLTAEELDEIRYKALALRQLTDDSGNT
jgi:adenosine deaminase